MSWGQLSPTNSWQKDGLWLNTLVSMKQNVSLHSKKNSSSERLPGTPESFWTGEHLGFTSASRVEPWPGSPTHGNEQKHMVRMASLQFQGNCSTSKPEKWPANPGSNQFNSWIHTLKSARAEWRSYSKTKPLRCLLWLWLSKTVGVRIFPGVEAARTTIQRTHTSSWEDTSVVPFQHDWITPRTDDNSILHISLPERCSVILLISTLPSISGDQVQMTGPLVYIHSRVLCSLRGGWGRCWMANKGKEHTCHSELFFKILGTWFVSFLLAWAACFL